METKWQIVMAQRGWIYVGCITREGDHYVLRNTYNIRQWRTGAGLGLLAQRGPRDGDVLDYYGTLRLHVLAVAGGNLECNDEAWNVWHARAAAELAKKAKK